MGGDHICHSTPGVVLENGAVAKRSRRPDRQLSKNESLAARPGDPCTLQGVQDSIVLASIKVKRLEETFLSKSFKVVKEVLSFLSSS